MYATLANLQTLCGDEELIQLTDRADPPSGEIDHVVVGAALTAAGHIIDGYVRAQYRLPLSSPVPMLTDLACDIARYRLYNTAATEQVQKRFDDAIKMLVSISKGLIKLPVADDVVDGEPAGRPGMVRTANEPRLFSRSSMRGM